MFTTYACFGLVLSSEVPLPELGAPVEADAAPDVVVRVGRVEPPAQPSPLPHGLWREGTSCGVEVPDVGRYEARAGRELVVDPAPGAEASAVRLFLLGSMMGAIMMQRGHLVLHGTAVRVADACTVVLGHSGSGKSTLAAEFHRRRHDVLSDDVVPVDAAGLAVPSYPRIKLWDDALARMGVATDTLERVREGHDKFHLPLRRGGLDPLPVRWIYVLERHRGPGLSLVPERGAGVFALLHEHTYRNELVHGADAVAAHLRQCAALMTGARMSRVRRSAAAMSPVATADAILADIETERTDQTHQERA